VSNAVAILTLILSFYLLLEKFCFYNYRYHCLLLVMISARRTFVFRVKKEESCFSYAFSISIRPFKERHKRQSSLKELIYQPAHRSIICDVIHPPPLQIPSHIHISWNSPETSTRQYHSTLRKFSKELGSDLHRDESLKSRAVWDSWRGHSLILVWMKSYQIREKHCVTLHTAGTGGGRVGSSLPLT
jgi:hypothetical protein